MSKKEYPKYVDANHSPNPTHPSEILKDELEARKITQKAFAEQLKMQPSMVNELVNGKRNFTPEIALKIEQTLGINAEFWLKMQTTYRVATLRNQARKEVEKSNLPLAKKNKIVNAL